MQEIEAFNRAKEEARVAAMRLKREKEEQSKSLDAIIKPHLTQSDVDVHIEKQESEIEIIAAEISKANKIIRADRLTAAETRKEINYHKVHTSQIDLEMKAVRMEMSRRTKECDSKVRSIENPSLAASSRRTSRESSVCATPLGVSAPMGTASGLSFSSLPNTLSTALVSAHESHFSSPSLLSPHSRQSRSSSSKIRGSLGRLLQGLSMSMSTTNTNGEGEKMEEVGRKAVMNSGSGSGSGEGTGSDPLANALFNALNIQKQKQSEKATDVKVDVGVDVNGDIDIEAVQVDGAETQREREREREKEREREREESSEDDSTSKNMKKGREKWRMKSDRQSIISLLSASSMGDGDEEGEGEGEEEEEGEDGDEEDGEAENKYSSSIRMRNGSSGRLLHALVNSSVEGGGGGENSILRSGSNGLHFSIGDKGSRKSIGGLLVTARIPYEREGEREHESDSGNENENESGSDNVRSSSSRSVIAGDSGSGSGSGSSNIVRGSGNGSGSGSGSGSYLDNAEGRGTEDGILLDSTVEEENTHDVDLIR